MPSDACQQRGSPLQQHVNGCPMSDDNAACAPLMLDPQQQLCRTLEPCHMPMQEANDHLKQYALRQFLRVL